ncbi:MAG: DUF58 domain-containing protein [Desulfuromonas sp.]|uniref:DUF58 domain-containing protein n=1 Tax=Desulfuromonas sp. TaxID=892 RepID=UPI000CB610A9|nr:DUF58 domain-containing protein [Desulfuromonas sp.]PLX81672.1 MAG: DUF58 domain-containing protein [Desulfuromonas sp.]
MNLFGSKPDRQGEGVRVSAGELVELRRAARGLPLRSAQVRAQQGGTYLSAFKGRGMEFEEVRSYQPGDDIRNLDWRVTARTCKPHTKLFREERERPVLLWVDVRAPMFFGTRGVFKAVQASRAAALLAWSAVGQGDRLGGLVFSETQHREMRPRQGRDAALQFIRLISGHPAWDKGERQASDAPWTLRRLRRVARPGSLVFLFSDFRHLGPEAEANLRSLSRHCDLVLVFVHDPLERELPPSGRYRVSDGAGEALFDSGDDRVRHSHRNRFEAHMERLRTLCSRHGMFLLPLATDDDPAGRLRQGLMLRSP